MVEKRYEIPQGVDIDVHNSLVTVKAGGKEVKREFKAKHISIKKAERTIIVSTESRKKADFAILGTIVAHIGNMVRGARDGITYKLRIVYAHFPMTATYQNNIFSVSNFLGEKTSRKVELPGGVNIEIKGQEITLTGSDKEVLGIAASRIEHVCNITKRDRRIFQDGIYIVEKDGKSIL